MDAGLEMLVAGQKEGQVSDFEAGSLWAKVSVRTGQCWVSRQAPT